jgi:hypothetical protein
VSQADARRRDPRHDQAVLRTLAVWIGVHLLLVAAIGGPPFVACQSREQATNLFGGCGQNLALIAAVIGWIQLIYGLVAGAIILLRGKHMAVGQGIFIATSAVAILFTALCFGAIWL